MQPNSNVPTPPPPPDTIATIAAQPHADQPSVSEVYATICSQIIKEQGRIIGGLSYEQASHVAGLQVDPNTYNCVITSNGEKVLEDLVEKYREFFGNAAVEVCREAASHFMESLPNEQVPALLRG
jgi:hypothetical protein